MKHRSVTRVVVAALLHAVLIPISPVLADSLKGKAMNNATRAAAATPLPAATRDLLAALPMPAGYAQTSNADVVVDGDRAQLVRFERNDGRNTGLGGEHFSAVIDSAGRLKGFTRMDLTLSTGSLPDQNKAREIAMRFLAVHASDLLPRLEINFVAPHEEVLRADGREVPVTGMKVKMRNRADGRWFWVIVGSDRQVMVFERDIVWANLKGRRQTEKWLHDSWQSENTPNLKARGA